MIGVKPPFLVRTLLNRYVWNMGDRENNVYLTFDDGPDPEITPWVLSKLSEFDAKATFFCIGRNVERNIELFKEIGRQGHSIGNHTYSHLNGLKTENKVYFDDIDLADNVVQSDLFRPPYGLIKRSQGKHLVKKYKVVMWDVLSYDFSDKVNPEKCLKAVKSKIRKGSILVFHDSQRAWKNLEYALPNTLCYLKENGYNCKSITIKNFEK